MFVAMMVWSLIRRFRWFTDRDTHDADRALDYYLSPERLRAALLRERHRADRSGGLFSLLTLTLEPKDRHPGGLARLANVLRGRLRVTDEPGLWPDRRVSILLPDTPPAGAWVLADDLSHLAAKASLSFTAAVDAYPPFARDMAESKRPAMPAAAKREVGAVEACLAHPLPLWKRATDVVGAAVGLLALAPVFAAVAAAIKYTSPGPVIYCQRREGLGGREFMMYKFRTMQVGADAEQARLRALSEQDGPAFKLTHDPRVTAIGKFLRTTSIDELPQLWNVLRGEMSLVGPRPLPCEESRACEPWQRRRLDVTPGITCIWQVRGRSRVTFAEWVRMDLEYIARRSVLTDMNLLLATVPAVLLRRGAK
jgi:lipopolysaccharide/colanic/teichoic acid biosynthesis glycosyltransferase